MKYAILHGDYNIYHADFETYEEAKEYYDHQIGAEGYLNDLKLCKILETHEAPEREYEPLTNGRHWNIDTSRYIRDIDTSEVKIEKLDVSSYSPWFNKGRY